MQKFIAVALIALVALGATPKVAGNPFRPEGDKCINILAIAECVTCALEMGAEILEAFLEPELFDEAMEELEKEAPHCVKVCLEAGDQEWAKCQHGKQVCKTDFCATCCAPGMACLKNDWGSACSPPQKECQCGRNSGNPDGCCKGSTGNYCGNDFHMLSCYGSKPVCCTNDLNDPVCCPKGYSCHSPLVGNSSCVPPFNATVITPPPPTDQLPDESDQDV